MDQTIRLSLYSVVSLQIAIEEKLREQIVLSHLQQCRDSGRLKHIRFSALQVCFHVLPSFSSIICCVICFHCGYYLVFERKNSPKRTSARNRKDEYEICSRGKIAVDIKKATLDNVTLGEQSACLPNAADWFSIIFCTEIN